MRKIFCFTAALLIAGSAVAAGEVWRWKDSAGTWHYSDQPQPGAELVRRSGRVESAPAAASNAAAAPAPPPSTNLPPVSDEAAADMRKDVAAIKAEQCKKAEENYQGIIKARVVAKKDEAGNQTFMTAAEIDAARLQALNVRNLACGDGA